MVRLLKNLIFTMLTRMGLREWLVRLSENLVIKTAKRMGLKGTKVIVIMAMKLPDWLGRTGPKMMS